MRNNLAALPLLSLSLVAGCASQSGLHSPPPLQDPTRNAGFERPPVVVPAGPALSCLQATKPTVMPPQT